MTDAPALGLSVAFLAGILSFLSPCVLPLVPSYVGFITGMSVNELAGRRRTALLHAGLFVLGFSLVFIALGAGATALGSTLRTYKDVIARVGGVLIILFGLVCLGVIKSRLLATDGRMHLEDKPVGYLGTLLVGITFGAGWTPCIGPILGAILNLALVETEVRRGVVLLTAYSAGLAVPFLLAALLVDRFLGWFQRFRRYLPWVMRVTGVLLILVGLLMVTGQFTRLAGLLANLTPAFLRSRI